MPQTRTRPALYQYRLEFFKVRGGERVHELPLARADFDRAVEATFFDGLRRGLFTEYTPPFAAARIEPAFASGKQGSPNAEGFRVVLPLPDGGEHAQEFPAEFFDRRALRIGTELVRAESVPNNSTLLYQLVRVPGERGGAGATRTPLHAGAGVGRSADPAGQPGRLRAARGVGRAGHGRDAGADPAPRDRRGGRGGGEGAGARGRRGAARPPAARHARRANCSSR